MCSQLYVCVRCEYAYYLVTCVQPRDVCAHAKLYMCEFYHLFIKTGRIHGHRWGHEKNK